MKRIYLKYTLGLCLAACVVSAKLHAQQMPLYSQYMMNGFILNPAVAGSDGFTTIALSSRDHMMGFDNSPKTYVLSVQARLMRTNYKLKTIPLSKRKRKINIKQSGRVGLGCSVFNDRNGYIERTGGQLTYAYHIYKRTIQYSLGVSVSTFQFKLNTQSLKLDDPILNQNFSNKMLVPDATVGCYVLSTNYFGGFSIANLFQTRIRIGSETYDYRMYRHYFLMGGIRFMQDQVVSYEPSFLIKSSELGAGQADLQMRFYYQKDYYLGVTYRTNAAVGIIMGLKWKRLNLGYAFDYSLTPLQQYSFGAHEINLALKLGDNTRRYNWLIRY